jgi:branched-chain amino acid transport system substrate-binding protein
MFSKREKGLSLVVACLFLVSALLMGGCGSGQPSASKAEANVKVGVVAPLQTEHGVQIKEAVTLAADEINAAGGINGRKLELVFADDENSAEKGLAALKKLYTVEKVDLVVGGVASGVVNGMFDFMAQNKKIWLGTGAATPVIIERIQKDYEKYKYYFRVGTLDSTNQGDAIAEFIVEVLQKKHGMTKAAILSTNLKYSQDISEAVAKKIEAAGIQVVYREYFNSDTTDFSPNFTNAQKAGAQFIINTILGPEGITYVKQWNDNKVPLPLVGAIAFATKDEFYKETGGKAAFETTANPNSGPAPLTPKTVEFAKKFKDKYGHSANFIAYPAYDALYVLKDAAARAKTLETEALIKALEATDYKGAAPVKFTKDHDLVYGGANARFVFFQFNEQGERVAVFPKEFANGEWQLPSWLKK